MQRLLTPLGTLCLLTCLLAVGLLLSACGGQPSEVYTLTSVLPSPATPGAEVVAYGELPAAATIHLGDTPLIGTPVAGGLQTTVPEAAVAGTHEFTVTAGEQTLTGVLQVVPRIDTVTVKGDQLTVTGAGWAATPTDTTQVSLLVSGSTLTPEVSVGRLSATLPDALAYGALGVRVRVGEQTSNPHTLTRSAGAIKGVVELPASGADEAAELRTRASHRASLSQKVDTLTALNVFHDETLETAQLENLVNAQPLPALGLTRLEFSSPAAAKAAHAQFLNDSYRVEYDLPVHTDSLEILNAEAPAEPGEGQWFLPLLGLEPAWSTTKGAGVVVAVVDTGVQLDHPDLVENLLPGYDFVDDDTEPYDLAGHGTHVAGLVAANGQVLGTAPEAKLLPVRVLEGTAGGSVFTVAQGVLWAAGLLETLPNPNPAQVINLSLGSSGYTETLASAVREAQAAGVVVVAATGNSGAPPAYPAALPGVVSVTALAGPEIAYQPWYANRGSGTLLTGYGGDTTQDQDGDGIADGVLSTDLEGYSLRMGTSMASPQVAGLVALALASGTPAHLVAGTLSGTAADLGVPGYDPNFGHGLATGRTASSSDPRGYVVALDAQGELIAWTLVQADLSYTLSNLPPGRPVQLLALSDEDGDGIVGEAGELISSTETVTPRDGATLPLPALRLSLSAGDALLTLETLP